MCEHEECEHSLGPSSHCDGCDREDKDVLTAATIRECHKQLKAVQITDPKELSEYIIEQIVKGMYNLGRM